MRPKKEQSHYIDAILDLYPNMSRSTVFAHKSIRQCTYKEMYEDFKERLEVIAKAQDMFIEIEPKELKNLKEFRGKVGSRRNEFLISLYSSREQIPPKSFIERVKRIIKQWENQADICTSCIHYNEEKLFCNYLDTYTTKNFYCKALEKDD